MRVDARRLTAAASRQRPTELELSNIRGQVEEDVRLALTTLKTAAVQVRAADESVMLAQRELEMLGTGSNLAWGTIWK